MNGVVRSNLERRAEMTLCPIAIAVGCKKCPIVTVCPLKGVIGDYTKQDDPSPKQPAGKSGSGGTGKK
jgi:hypothetical protein